MPVLSNVAARPSLPLPDKPSIAVLPFTNMSGDPEQDYFADGIVEDIITGLSRIKWLFVIARNSSFAYKGKAIDVKQVGRELGVRYVLEGSVRKSGNRVRITAQLIDAETGRHIWAERYDRALDDIFAVQDELTMSVVGVIEPTLRKAEIERAQPQAARQPRRLRPVSPRPAACLHSDARGCGQGAAVARAGDRARAGLRRGARDDRVVSRAAVPARRPPRGGEAAAAPAMRARRSLPAPTMRRRSRPPALSSL